MGGQKVLLEHSTSAGFSDDHFVDGQNSNRVKPLTLAFFFRFLEGAFLREAELKAEAWAALLQSSGTVCTGCKMRVAYMAAGPHRLLVGESVLDSFSSKKIQSSPQEQNSVAYRGMDH